MKSSVLSAREFFQLTINSLLELCTHCIDGHRIVSFEGRLLLGLETGAKVELNIHQQDVSKMSTSVQADDTNKSSSAAVSDVGKNTEGNLSKTGETVVAVEDSVGLESLNDMHVQQASMLASAHETDLHSSSVDDGEQSFPDAESVPSAVLQTNGEFMCSWCGVTMKFARAIKRHISTHMSLESFRPPTTVSCETVDDTEDVCEDEVSQKQPEEQLTAQKRLKTPDNSADSSKRLQNPESSEDSGTKWRSYPCKDCDSIFTASGLLQRHRVQMHKPTQCQICGMVLAGKWNFSQHVRREHPGVKICKDVISDVDKKLKGELPPETENGLAVDGSVGLKSLNNAYKRYVSKDSVAELRSYPCRKCDGVVFGSRSLLSWHNVQTHREHQCQKCGLVFNGRSEFAEHVHKEHPGLPIYKAQKLYVCEYCSRTFVCSAVLRDHISTVHLGTVEHRCAECGKVLVSAASLRIHQRQVHEIDYRRTCDGCGRQFSRTTALLDHVTCAHPHLLPDKHRGRLDRLACKRCSMTFTSRSSLKRHLEVRHSDAPKHRCPVCSRSFRCRRYVLRHVRLHHPGTSDCTAAKHSPLVIDTGSANDDSDSALTATCSVSPPTPLP